MDTFAALHAFVTVVEHSGFAPAARQMGLATSSVTRQVDALEQSLGVRLLNRSTRNVTLTNSGEQYFDHAVRLLQDLANANLEVSESSGLPQGRLRIGLPVAFARLHIAPALADFARQYPRVSLDLVLSDSISDLVEQRLDLAIRLGNPQAQDLVAKRLASHRRLVCASPEYVAERGAPMTPPDLAHHDCLTFSYGSRKANWQFCGPSEHQVRVAGRLTANNSETLQQAALGGMGIILMPSWLVGPDIAAGRLVRLLSSWEAGLGEKDGGIFAVYLPNRRSSSKVQAFIAFLCGHFGSPPYWDEGGAA